jgi:two-component system response regulator FixJ
MDASPADTKAIIAVVDNDDAILDALELLLAVSGWEARTYKTGEAFMDDLTENTPSCLILDSHLSGLSGADVARALSTRKPAIPIIGITARPGSKLANEVLSAGADVMLTKPVSAENIVSKVRAAMA